MLSWLFYFILFYLVILDKLFGDFNMSQHVLTKDAVITDATILSTDAENSKKTFEMF